VVLVEITNIEKERALLVTAVAGPIDQAAGDPSSQVQLNREFRGIALVLPERLFSDTQCSERDEIFTKATAAHRAFFGNAIFALCKHIGFPILG